MSYYVIGDEKSSFSKIIFNKETIFNKDLIINGKLINNGEMYFTSKTIGITDIQEKDIM